MRLHPGFAKPRSRKPPQKRAAERRQAQLHWSRTIGCSSAPHERMLPAVRTSGALGAPRRRLARRLNALPQPRPRFTRSGGRRLSPAPSNALKRSTSRTGHNAGRVDAWTARERGYEPRPQEPHSLHQSAVTGDAPWRARFGKCNLNSDKRQVPSPN